MGTKFHVHTESFENACSFNSLQHQTFIFVVLMRCLLFPIIYIAHIGGRDHCRGGRDDYRSGRDDIVVDAMIIEEAVVMTLSVSLSLYFSISLSVSI